MASSWFLIKLAFKCLQHFAWPLVALLYPLCASIQAIETDSYAETIDLISYWILLSLIYLFEYTFMTLLLWFHLWLYVKLMIVVWLIVPNFGRASYVYNNVRSMKPRIVAYMLNNCWWKCFVEKDNFLMHVERYVKENGTEALEKVISSKTNGERHETEHRDVKDLEAIEQKEIPVIKQDIPVMPKIEPSQNVSSTTVETKGTSKSDRAGEVVPQSSTQKEVQKEWTCALCLVRTTSETTLNSHLSGRKHRTAVFKALIAKKPPTLVETKGTSESDRAGQEVPQSSTQKEVQKEWSCALCLVRTSSETTLNSHLSGKKHRAKCEAALEVKKQHALQKNLSEPFRIINSKLICTVCNVMISNEEFMASHLIGRKHLSNIQS